MKLDKNIAQKMLKVVRSVTKPDSLADDAVAYNLDDILAVFNVNEEDNKQTFSGLTFEMLGRDFHILPSLELVLSESSGEDEEVYSIEDDEFEKIINDYLEWRINVLEKIGM